MEPPGWGAAAAREIALCWLAHALRATTRRVRNVSATGEIEVVSVAAGCDPTVLATLLRAVRTHDDERSLHVTTAERLDDSQLQQMQRNARVRVVCTEIAEGEAWRAFHQLRPPMALSSSPSTAWIFVGFECTFDTGLSLRVAVHGSSDIEAADLDAAVQPLHELCDQCGLPLALELLTKLTASTETPRDDGSSTSLLASPTPSQLPFQLLVMLLRWTYFHPSVVTLLGKPFRRKLALIPQPRVRKEMVALHAKQARLWREIHGHTIDTMNQAIHPRRARHQLRLLSDEITELNDGDHKTLAPLQRLSQCALWDKQKQFYRDQGIRAWSNHLIPFGVSSSSYLAMQYARLAVDFLRHTCGGITVTTRSSTAPSPRTPNCFVWEAASGSCKFLHSFLLHFYTLVERDQLEERFGIVPCVVASDLSEQVLQSREEMACFRKYIADGRLDFAAFDTDEFLHSRHGDERGVLYLRHTGVKWRVGRERGPVFIIGNYFFDSLRSDVYVVTQQHTEESDATIDIREARLDSTTDNIPDMLFSLAKLRHHPRDVPAYADSTMNATFVAVLDRLQGEWEHVRKEDFQSSVGTDQPATSSSLLLFPVEAVAFLKAVLCPSDDKSFSFPVAIVTGDATFSFRDGVPSTFIDDESGDLEIPQLSPHPDCFCLPVDLEILEIAVTTMYRTGSASIVSTPSSDTFNVFFALSPALSDQHKRDLSERFHHVFDQFTPCDCDLLWGLTSVDNGATHLSRVSQMALLAQTAWDFDVFSVLQWKLLHNWKKRLKDLEFGDTSDADAMRLCVKRERRQLIELGRQCVKTHYVMDDSQQGSATAVMHLQIARWFYELRTLSDTKAMLGSVVSDHARIQIAAVHLAGLVAYRQDDLWTALACFRNGQQLEPNRQRPKKWVARTLIRLQELKKHVR